MERTIGAPPYLLSFAPVTPHPGTVQYYTMRGCGHAPDLDPYRPVTGMSSIRRLSGFDSPSPVSSTRRGTALGFGLTFALSLTWYIRTPGAKFASATVALTR